MKIKMTQSAFGSANESGNATREYKEGEIISCEKEWEKVLGQIFLDEGFAIEVKIAEPKEKKASKKVAKKKTSKKK